MNILFVSGRKPWPPHDGGRLRTYSLLHGLSQQHDVTLVALSKEGPGSSVLKESPFGKRCDRIIELEERSCVRYQTSRFDLWAPFPDRIWSLVSSQLPGLVKSWYSDELFRVLCHLRRTERFEAVWVERSFLAETARLAGFDRLVVDVDNLESVCLDAYNRATHPGIPRNCFITQKW